jgi:hypothetical protein
VAPCAALFFSNLQHDDRGGRDALYPTDLAPEVTALSSRGIVILAALMLGAAFGAMPRSNSTTSLRISKSWIGVKSLSDHEI